MHREDHRYRPRVAIPLPSGSQPPAHSTQNFPTSGYSLEVTPPEYDEYLSNPWDSPVSSIETPRPRAHTMSTVPPRPPSRSSSSNSLIAFPEPQIYRSVSAMESGQSLAHRKSRSDLGPPGHTLHHNPSTASFAESYYPDDETRSEDLHGQANAPSPGFSDLTSDPVKNLDLFQYGKLREKDEEWHLLVSGQAREALGKEEAERQSIMFELIKAERDYVFDLESIREVFVEPLRNASPPIIPSSKIDAFIAEVFGNFASILSHHQRLVAALFARQRDEHPLISSVADIFLDTILKADWRSEYEAYIKHYPFAESHHRTEVKRNHSYESFLQEAQRSPRIRKRDINVFIARPVSRLTRLQLLLSTLLKRTDKSHTDIESLTIICDILTDFLKSTEPGIAAAESKVKFWGFCASLRFQAGEIIDMNLYDSTRTLVYSGPASRRTRSEGVWADSSESLHLALLDHYFVSTHEHTTEDGVVERRIRSRPIPLSFLRLGSFESTPETHLQSHGILDTLRNNSVVLYPFTIYHASGATRRYTYYVTSEGLRKKWKDALVNAIAVYKARQEGNMWFNPQQLTDRFFRASSLKVPSNSISNLTGKITSATPFASGGRRLIAVGCLSGVYVSLRGDENFRKILKLSDPTSMAVFQTMGDKIFNKFVIHYHSSLVCYSLDIFARVALGQAQPKTLDASFEKITSSDVNVLFFRQAKIGSRLLIIYVSKKLLQVTLHVLEAVETPEVSFTPTKRSAGTAVHSFRTFGTSGYVPKNAHDITPLVKSIGISTSSGIVIADPTNLANSAITVVPDLSETDKKPVASLKARVQGAKPLGLVRFDASELLVIYDVLGCYITKHGQPSRSAGYIRWETQAVSYAVRGPHVLLFSPQFIEVRNVTNGRLVQVLEGADIRLLHSGSAGLSEENILVAMRGAKDDQEGVSDKIVELVETTEIPAVTPAAGPHPAFWDEWDM